MTPSPAALGLLALALGASAGCLGPQVPGQPAPNAGTGGQATGTGGTAAGGSAGGRPDFTASWGGAPGDAGSAASGGTGLSPDRRVCGLARLDTEPKPPEILVVLDRSTSMLETGRGSESKWTSVTVALDAVMEKTQAAVSWGLKMFPLGPRSCDVPDGIEVPPALSSRARIKAVIEANGPGTNGATPTQVALRGALAYLRPRLTGNQYLLLATDGLPICSTTSSWWDFEGTVQAVTDTAAAGIPTFVLGIATTDRTEKMVLSDMARAGGKPRKDPDVLYYSAQSRDELVAALTQITTEVATCLFKLPDAPPSADDVAVEADGLRVPRDPARQEGWDYAADMRSITLYGSWCARVKDASLRNVKVVFGCPGIPII